MNCKDCIRHNMCWQKENPPKNCQRYDRFLDSWKFKNIELEIRLKVIEREISLNKPVEGPL